MAGFLRCGAFCTTQLLVRLPNALSVVIGPGCDASPMRIPLPIAVVWAREHSLMIVRCIRVGGLPVVWSIHLATACGVGSVAFVVVWRGRGVRVLRRRRRLFLGLAASDV